MRHGPVSRRVLEVLRLGPADCHQISARLGLPLVSVRRSLTTLRHHRLVEHRGAPSVGRHGRLPALWRISEPPGVRAQAARRRQPGSVERDLDVLDSLETIGPCTVRQLCVHTGRTRAAVLRALDQLRARLLATRISLHLWRAR